MAQPNQAANDDPQDQDQLMFRQKGRFYEEEFPECETTVVVTVNKMDEKIGAYVSLLEYDGKEGMINLGELSKKRIRSMTKVLRIGSTEVCMVMSVDEEKGYVNLSKKRVEPEDAPPRQEAYARAKAVHGVMQHIASSHDIPVEELCSKVSWPLYKKFPSAYEAFKLHTTEEINVWDSVDFSQPGMDLSHLADKLKEEIETHMKRRLITAVLRLQAKCDVSCSEYEGIDAVKAALKEGFKASQPECEVSIKLVAHPTFILTCMTREKVIGVEVLTKAMEFIKTAIEAAGGEFKVISTPDIKKDEPDPNANPDPKSGSESGSESSGPEDETMGDLTAEQLKALEKTAGSEDEK